MRMIGKEAAESDVDKDPPVSIAEAIARNQLSAHEKKRAGAWKRKTLKRSRALAREVHDFVWKKNWDVLPTRERLHHFGVVPSEQCPNCRATESAQACAVRVPRRKARLAASG
ncbi:hypothetical protein MTO96_034301 [Rhipicephalus appendiculatus]